MGHAFEFQFEKIIRKLKILIWFVVFKEKQEVAI
jgi:hypothetical protein